MFSNTAESFFNNTILYFSVLVILMLLVMFIAFKAGVAITIMSYLDLSRHSEPAPVPTPAPVPVSVSAPVPAPKV